LSELEGVRAKAQAEADQRIEKQRSLNAEIDGLRKEEQEQLKRIEQAESELRSHEERRREAASKPLSQQPASNGDESKSVTPYDGPDETPWLLIDLDPSSNRVSASKEIEIVTAETTADLAVFEPADPDQTAAGDSLTAPSAIKAESKPASNGNDPSFSPEMAERLQGANLSERVAALADLAESGGDDAFRLITKSFDDPSVEVRNAAARALYHLHPDLAASFTRALREASPERRRKIGAAIAGSGLAANAINSLTGEGRDRTYDAFSMLFLMAKAGEVQPLMQAIAKHPNHEVRLTAVKLLALSNQPQILPAFRSLAARETLPADVHTAVMEAIYLLSNQSREVV
jgi:HEAT repeat protein